MKKKEHIVFDIFCSWLGDDYTFTRGAIFNGDELKRVIINGPNALVMLRESVSIRRTMKKIDSLVRDFNSSTHYGERIFFMTLIERERAAVDGVWFPQKRVLNLIPHKIKRRHAGWFFAKAMNIIHYTRCDCFTCQGPVSALINKPQRRSRARRLL